MKTTILAAAAATVLGLAGGTAWTVVTREPAPLPADSMAVAGPGGEHPADSTAVAEHAAPDAETATGHTEDGPTGHADDGAASDAHDPGVLSTPQPQPGPAGAAGTADAPGQPAAAETEAEDGADQLARIFTAMQPRDAARVLAQLTDPEIREILTRMGARQAASVLSNMSPERAAVLSRTVLAGDEGGA